MFASDPRDLWLALALIAHVARGACSVQFATLEIHEFLKKKKIKKLKINFL